MSSLFSQLNGTPCGRALPVIEQFLKPISRSAASRTAGSGSALQAAPRLEGGRASAEAERRPLRHLGLRVVNPAIDSGCWQPLKQQAPTAVLFLTALQEMCRDTPRTQAQGQGEVNRTAAELPEQHCKQEAGSTQRLLLLWQDSVLHCRLRRSFSTASGCSPGRWRNPVLVSRKVSRSSAAAIAVRRLAKTAQAFGVAYAAPPTLWSGVVTRQWQALNQRPASASSRTEGSASSSNLPWGSQVEDRSPLQRKSRRSGHWTDR